MDWRVTTEVLVEVREDRGGCMTGWCLVRAQELAWGTLVNCPYSAACSLCAPVNIHNLEVPPN